MKHIIFNISITADKSLDKIVYFNYLHIILWRLLLKIVVLNPLPIKVI
jgi:hypothetical protein